MNVQIYLAIKIIQILILNPNRINWIIFYTLWSSGWFYAPHPKNVCPHKDINTLLSTFKCHQVARWLQSHMNGVNWVSSSLHRSSLKYSLFSNIKRSKMIKVLWPFYIKTKPLHKSILEQRRGTPWTSCQFNTGLTYRDRQPSTLTFTPTGTLESPITRQFLDWGRNSNSGPSCCEATALTTAPPCHPHFLSSHIIYYHIVKPYERVACGLQGLYNGRRNLGTLVEHPWLYD